MRTTVARGMPVIFVLFFCGGPWFNHLWDPLRENFRKGIFVAYLNIIFLYECSFFPTWVFTRVQAFSVWFYMFMC